MIRFTGSSSAFPHFSVFMHGERNLEKRLSFFQYTAECKFVSYNDHESTPANYFS